MWTLTEVLIQLHTIGDIQTWPLVYSNPSIKQLTDSAGVSPDWHALSARRIPCWVTLASTEISAAATRTTRVVC